MPIPKPDAITVPKEFLGVGTTEQRHRDYFAYVFGIPADVLEIHEIPETQSYLIGPVGVAIRYTSETWNWHHSPNRLQLGYVIARS